LIEAWSSVEWGLSKGYRWSWLHHLNRPLASARRQPKAHIDDAQEISGEGAARGVLWREDLGQNEAPRGHSSDGSAEGHPMPSIVSRMSGEASVDEAGVGEEPPMRPKVGFLLAGLVRVSLLSSRDRLATPADRAGARLHSALSQPSAQ
jgi:hypothetical protein